MKSVARGVLRASETPRRTLEYEQPAEKKKLKNLYLEKVKGYPVNLVRKPK